MATKPVHFNYFKEKRILIEEEKALMKMMDKFQDQLNRLKIEELALMSLIKMQGSKPTSTDGEPVPKRARSSYQGTNTSVVSDLSQVSSVIPVGVVEPLNQNINEEEVDLDIDVFEQGMLMDDVQVEEEEEEEEEEDREDNKEEIERNLRHFLDL